MSRITATGLFRSSLVILAAWLMVACSDQDRTSWADVTPSSGADRYEGSIERPLDDRLASLVTERKLKVLDSRIEYLPAGVDWESHLAFRDDRPGELTRVEDRFPEPDAPVLVAEYRVDSRTLFVVGRADEAGSRLVVLTALTE